MGENILAQLETLSDKQKLLEAISMYKKQAFLVKKTKRSGVYMSVLIKYMEGMGSEQRDLTLQSLERRVTAMRTMTLTLSYEPPTQHISEFSETVKSVYGRDVVIKLQVEASIVAGAKIEIDGRYTDNSLKRALDEVSLTGFTL